MFKIDYTVHAYSIIFQLFESIDNEKSECEKIKNISFMKMSIIVFD